MIINIYLYSKNFKSLTLFLKFLNKFNATKLLKHKTKIKKFSILTSPHVNKDAQEQFELNIFTKQLKNYSFNFFKILIILKKISKKIFPDIQIKIKFLFLKKKKFFLEQNIINSDNMIIIKPNIANNLYIKKPTNNYFTMLDISGEILFNNKIF